MTVPHPTGDDHQPTPINLLAAMKPVAVNLDLVVNDLWQSSTIWDLAKRLSLRSAALPPSARMELRSLLTASERLEQDIHRLEAAYQLLVDFVEAAQVLQALGRKAGR